MYVANLLIFLLFNRLQPGKYVCIYIHVQIDASLILKPLRSGFAIDPNSISLPYVGSLYYVND